MITRESAVGMFIGLAVGDALGAPLEFQDSRDPENYITRFTTGGVHDVSIGEWTDDTSMALAMAEAMIECNGKFRPHAVMVNFCDWYNKGRFSPRGRCFDIGNTTRKALDLYKSGAGAVYCGSAGVNSAGNGALMRLAPAIIAAHTPEQAIEYAVAQTILTHGHYDCIEYSRTFAEELWRGAPLQKYMDWRLDPATDRTEVRSGGHVKETYECAMWAFQTTDNFEDCVIAAVNRGHDSDTCGAVAGMIAGAHYGHHRIPAHFKDNLMWHDRLVHIASSLHRKARENVIG
jgi:ADP-ribosyl-[dinitrogen reductase] hydrolase